MDTPPSTTEKPKAKPRKRGPGRPRREELSRRKAQAGDAAIMKSFKQRLLASPKSRRVVDKIVDTALEDGHPHQAACMKMVFDRVSPVIAYEKDFRDHGGKPMIEINIRGVSVDEPKVIDAEVVEDDD